MVKIPSREDYAAFDGGYCRSLWAATSEDWRCPACRRTKFELLRWTQRRPPGGTPYMGWMAALHRHHDHGVDLLAVLAVQQGRLTPSPELEPAFPIAVLCDQCNRADGEAKKRLGLPADWSFSPDEIAMFIIATPHARHRVDLDAAKSAFDAANPPSPFDL